MFAHSSFALPARPRRTPVVAGWLFALSTIAFFRPTGAMAAVYTEAVPVEWGGVALRDGAAPEEVWFARTPPAFTADGAFTPEQQQCLREAMATKMRRLGDAEVLPLDTDTLAEMSRAVRERGCFGTGAFRITNPPPEWEAGRPTQDRWTMRVRYEAALVATPAPAAGLSIVLLLGPSSQLATARQVDLAALLADPNVARYAFELDAAARARVLAGAPWLRVFVVHPDAVARRMTHTDDLAPFAIPLAYALRAAAEATEMLKTQRTLSVALAPRLRDRLAPDSPQRFAGAERWFPEELRGSGALSKLDVNPPTQRNRLVAVDAPGSPDLAALPTGGDWVIRVGPFRPMGPAKVTIRAARGATTDHAAAALAEGDRTQNVRDNMAELKNRLTTALQRLDNSDSGRAVAAGGWFWRPAFADYHGRAIQLLERQRFTGDVRGVLEPDHVDYSVVFVPAYAKAVLTGSFASEEGLGTAAETTAHGLLHPADTLRLSVKLAHREVVGDLRFNVPYFKSLDEKTELAVRLLGTSGRDENFRLGGISSDAFKRHFGEAGVEHEVTHARGTWDAKLRFAVLWESHVLRRNDLAVFPRAEGLTLRARPGWRFRPDVARDAAVGWEFRFDAGFAWSGAAGWDRAFWRGDVTAGAKGSFGGAQNKPRAMFGELRLGFATNSSATPLALFPRAGNGEFLHGLEPGEFSGRELVRSEAIYGVRLSHLLSRFFKDKPDATPPILEQLFVQAIVEAAKISSKGAASRHGADTFLTSHGVAVEAPMQDSNDVSALRFGYAWSPDSVRTRGRVFTSLSMSF